MLKHFHIYGISFTVNVDPSKTKWNETVRNHKSSYSSLSPLLCLTTSLFICWQSYRPAHFIPNIWELFSKRLWMKSMTYLRFCDFLFFISLSNHHFLIKRYLHHLYFEISLFIFNILWTHAQLSLHRNRIIIACRKSMFLFSESIC